VRYLTQTTLSLDETTHLVNRLKQRFPLIEGPQSQDICYATENRQMAVKAISANVDLLLVVGSENSSNSKRLVEVGDNFGVNSHLVNDCRDVDPAWLDGVKNVGVTAGASAPEHLVQELIEFLRERGFQKMEEIELVDEDVRFSLPSELTISIQ
jgi:4-hydroxy-3-methylbut-2-enyl diphosphate reductase